MGRKGKSGDAGPDLDSRFRTTMEAMILGITPDEYAEFYSMANGMVKAATGMDLHDSPMPDNMMKPVVRTRHRGPSATVMKDAAEKTLTLKVQMQDVTKPPMWRELKVPADFTFFHLHKAIQAACGFEDCHLWQFQRRAYDPELQIGVPRDHNDPFGMGLEEWTDDARDTGLTAYLAAKGDKLVYVYDFGDDWIFDVSVTAVDPRDGDVAVCTRWKSDLQPMEDTGGIWSYLNMRTAMKEKDSLKPRQKKELAESLGFDSFDELEDCLSGALFDPEVVNNSLAEI